MEVTPKINEDEIISYYDHCEVDYKLVWQLDTALCMHYGYWEDDVVEHADALIRMNEKLAEYANINPGDKILDAGCGVGGASIWLASRFDVDVTGITLSPNQVERCKENAAKHNLSNRTTFLKANYLNTPFEDNSFDVVWAIESVCYAWDKADFLREAFRILKPGGRLVVADFFTDKLEEGTVGYRLMDKWTDAWAIKAYAVTDTFHSDMLAIGFSDIEIRDVTKNVFKSIRRLWRSFVPGLLVHYLYRSIGKRNKLQGANTWSTFYQYRAYKKGLWHYNIVSAAKPH